MLALVFVYTRNLARLGDPDFDLELTLNGEEGVKDSGDGRIGCTLFLLPGGRPRGFGPISSFTGSFSLPILLDIFRILLRGLL